MIGGVLDIGAAHHGDLLAAPYSLAQLHPDVI